MAREWLRDVQPGDFVKRMLGGTVPMELRVSEVTDDRIICGPWKFSRVNGAELDEDLGWDEQTTGSYLESYRQIR